MPEQNNFFALISTCIVGENTFGNNSYISIQTYFDSGFQYNPMAQKLVSSQLMSNGYFFPTPKEQLNSTQMETSLSDLNSYKKESFLYFDNSMWSS